MNLPAEYCRRMEKFFKINVEPWYDENPFKGIRINLLKADEKLLELLPYKTKSSPFAKNGYYIEGDYSGIGTNPFHHAGAYYVQEPSASCAVNALDVQPFDKVLDLCAAPGGKSGQIAEKLNGSGLLVSNEYVKNRVNALCSNMERLGVRNSIITNSDSSILCEKLAGYFDKVLVDAPCSGEGMMRKEAAALENWSIDSIRLCAQRQLEILNNAAKAVKPGGILVYSTCTFAPEENEIVVSQFLKTNEFELVDCAFNFGRRGYEQFGDGLSKTARIFPDDGGEGHFVAKMIKLGDVEHEEKIIHRSKSMSTPIDRNSKNKDIISEAVRLYESITSEPIYGEIAIFKDTVRLLPYDMPDLSRINVIRAGVDLAHIKNNRIEPAHGLFMAAKPQYLNNALDMDKSDERVRQFLNGQQIECDKSKGYCAAAVNGYIMGFGKCSNGVLKNHYPKGLRNLNL